MRWVASMTRAQAQQACQPSQGRKVQDVALFNSRLSFRKGLVSSLRLLFSFLAWLCYIATFCPREMSLGEKKRTDVSLKSGLNWQGDAGGENALSWPSCRRDQGESRKKDENVSKFKGLFPA